MPAKRLTMLLCFCNPSCHGYVCAFPSHLVKQMWMLIRWLYSLCWNFPSPRLLISPLFFTYQKKKKISLLCFSDLQIAWFSCLLVGASTCQGIPPLKSYQCQNFLTNEWSDLQSFFPLSATTIKGRCHSDANQSTWEVCWCHWIRWKTVVRW